MITPFLLPMVYLLVTAIITECLLFAKTKRVNMWLPVAFLAGTMFRVWWVWLAVLRIQEKGPGFLTPSTVTIALTVIFVPVMIQMFRQVKQVKEESVRWIAVVRAIPCIGVTFLFFQHLMVVAKVL